jgi:hypothetical protein
VRQEPATEVTTAASLTMRDSARVMMTCRTSVPEFDHHVGYVGIIDFGKDRCRLDEETPTADDAEAQVMILDGPNTYSREENGQWTVTRGGAGTRGMFHPSGLLDALMHAQTTVVRSSERTFEVGLDHDMLDARADAGLSRDWESIAVAELSASGRIAHVTLTHRAGKDPDAYIRIDCTISEPEQVDAIELPASELTISLHNYLEEQDRDRPGT